MTIDSSARQQIMARLRQTQIGAVPAAPDVAAWYRTHARQESPQARAERLRAALQAAHAEVHDVDAGNWAALALQIAVEKGVRRLLIGADTPHGEALAAANTHPDLQIVRYAQAIEAWKDELFDRIDAGLSAARSAIAETGSLVLWPDAREPRLMSLVPPLHIVLLDADTIHADFHSAMTAEGWAAGMPTNALLISGPSKTADIQQTLAYGAHGPRELVVLLQSTGNSAANRDGAGA